MLIYLLRLLLLQRQNFQEVYTHTRINQMNLSKVDHIFKIN